MAIGSPKIGVLGGLVAGGSCTLNVSGNFVVPPGVRCINIVGRGGSGNPGTAGNPGNPGNPGFGAPGGLGRLENPGTASHSEAGLALRSPAKLLGCIFSQTTPANINSALNQAPFPTPAPPGGRIAWQPFQSPFSGPWAAAGGSTRMWSSQQNVAGAYTGDAGESGNAGSAGNAGNPGNTGQQSTAFGCTFTGGAGGNAGVAGSAGNAGTGGTAGNPGGGSPQSNTGTPGPPNFGVTCPAGGTGGNGGGSGGPGITASCSIFQRQAAGVCTLCNPFFTALPPGGGPTIAFSSFSVGGGGAAATNIGGDGTRFTSVSNSCYSSPIWNVVVNQLGHGGTDANASAGNPPACICPGSVNFARCGFFSTNTMGGHGGFGPQCTGGHAIINSGEPCIFVSGAQIAQDPAGHCHLRGTGRFVGPTLGGTVPPFQYGPRTREFSPCFSPQPASQNNNIWRAGGGGGAGGVTNNPSINYWWCPSPQSGGAPNKYGCLFSRQINGVPSSAGGGGRGNAGNAGGASPTPSGAVANPSTFNSIPVTPGATCPIVVGSPGGCVVICWNPQ